MKQYCGNGKALKDKFGNSSLLFSINEKDLLILQQCMSINKSNGYKAVQMFISKRKEPGKYGDTHYGVINESKPRESGEGRGEGQGSAQGGSQQSFVPSASNSGRPVAGVAPEGHRYPDEDLPPKGDDPF